MTASQPTGGGTRRELLVLIPTFNERENLPLLLPALLAGPGEILVVDDASPDGTAEVVADWAAREPRVHLLRQARRIGFGPSCRAGLAWGVAAGFAKVLQMDADLSHDPAEVPALAAAAEHADLVVGSRYLGGAVRTRNWPWHRLWLSRGAGAYVRVLTGLPLSDPTGGFRCYRAGLLARLGTASQADGYLFQIEMAHAAWRAGARLAEHPIIFTERRNGASKMSGRIVLEAMLRVATLRWRSR